MILRLLIVLLATAALCNACDKNVYEARDRKLVRPVDGTASAVSLQWEG
jgi:hypothetical protein